MPLEGISNPGPLIPNQHLAEAHTLGAFESKVEQNEMIKKTNDEDESGKNSQEDDNEDQDNQDNLYKEELEGATNLYRNLDEGASDKSIGYTLKFNRYTELVELVDLKTGDLIQAISPKDLIDLVSKLRYRSGLFVDNKA